MASFNIPIGVQSWALVAPGDSRLGVSLEWDLDAQFPAFALGAAQAGTGTGALLAPKSIRSQLLCTYWGM